MDWSLRKLTARQIDKQVRPFKNFIVPSIGWIRTIRKALGINTRQLGEKTGVSGERIVRIEADELENKLTMATLQKMAEAMNCKFVYAFIPDDNLDKIIERAARDKAKAQMDRISHSMALEDQKTESKELKEQIDILTEEYLRGNLKNIWEK
ncbi:MAG: mobile mystery protein A [Rickettsiaceae bacterium]|nr:mobile mystery protein A [Rickettsiaceae bacterium]